MVLLDVFDMPQDENLLWIVTITILYLFSREFDHTHIWSLHLAVSKTRAFVTIYPQIVGHKHCREA